MKALIVVLVLVVVAIQHVSHRQSVRDWQDRQAARLECSIALAHMREDLVERYCDERQVKAPGSAATS